MTQITSIRNSTAYAAFGLALAWSMAAPRSAYAVLQLSFTATDLTTLASNSKTIVDGGAGDTSVPGGSTTQDGILTLANNTNPLPGVVVNGSNSEALGPPPLLSATSVLYSGSSSVTNNSPDPVHSVVAISATEFPGGPNGAFVTGSGTFELTPGSSITLNWFNDPADAQGANSSSDTPGNLIDTFTFTSVSGNDSFSINGDPFPVDDTGPYSMTLQFEYTLAPGGSLIDRGQSEITDAPEPGTLPLIATALAALGMLRRSRNPDRSFAPAPKRPNAATALANGSSGE